MINRNELRVGNFVNSELHGDYRIIGITNFSDDNALFWKSLEHYPQACSSIDLNGIELTEEWLVRLGFERDTETDFRWFLDKGKIAYDLDDNCIRISDSWEFGKRKYVHELQNLYFVLTGQELELKK